jgi:Flp pilus assembly protein TadD
VSTRESLESFIAKVRHLAAQARPPQRTPVTHAEAADPGLAAALAAAAATPSPIAFRLVAEEYRRLGIADRAEKYLQDARALDPRDAATYDALARLWRDGGLPALALSDAYRAVFYAPDSAVVRNTLGTVLQALGRRKEAREQYEHVLRLEPAAAYALNNLCYGWILDRAPHKAEAACRAALKIDPALAAARNNLGLALAARGQLDAAREAFTDAGDRGTGLFNIGIVHMARHKYADAVSAFAAAQQARPSLRMAAVRAKQAGKLAAAGAYE